MGVFLNKSGDGACEPNAFFAALFDTEPNKHVGKAHNAAAYLMITDRYLMNLFKRIMAGVDNIVEKSNSNSYSFCKLGPIQIGTIFGNEFCDINRAQVAGVILPVFQTSRQGSVAVVW